MAAIPGVPDSINTASKIPLINNISYDSPFLDMTSFYMPKSIKDLFRFISSVIYSDPIVSQCITKLAEYPITKIVYKDDGESINNSKFESKWKEILEDKLNIVDAMRSSGMDYYGYGTSLISINFPFKRMLTCPKCGSTQSVDSAKTIYKDAKFISSCKKCGHKGSMEAKDLPTKEINKLGFIFWDLINVHIKYNNISGEHFFYYTIPPNISRAVKTGDMDIVNGLRLEIIEAVEKNKKLKLSKTNLFHYKRPGVQYLYPDQRGWGIPVVMAVLKDVFYKRLLRKGNESIAFEHIVPLRILFPQVVGDVSPHSTINLGSWRGKVEDEIKAWKKDPNRVSIIPVPVGQLNFGGDGKMLLVSQDIKMVDEDIMIGIGIIPEIIKGGASWSGSNVSLRVVENTFLNHRKGMQGFLDWTVDSISRYFSLAKIKVSMEDFKMADDLQRKQMLNSMAQSNQISSETALKEMDLDPEVEYKQMLKEVNKTTEILTRVAESQAEAQGAASIVGALYQADAQAENQNRMEMHQREQQQKHDLEQQQSTQQRAGQTQQEAAQLAESQGVQEQKMSLPDLILILTKRFASLSRNDSEEFKIRMLAMKNSTPSLYQEVYDNLTEMNLIAADLLPDLRTAQVHTPGELPINSQGDTSAGTPPSPVEEGASPNVMNKAEVKPLPVAKPPRGQNAGI